VGRFNCRKWFVAAAKPSTRNMGAIVPTERQLATFIIGIEPTDDLPQHVREWTRALEADGHRFGPMDTLWTVRRFLGNPVPVLRIVGIAYTGLNAEAALVQGLAGDDPASWINPLLDKLTDWARFEGAPVLRGYGRRGWARMMNDVRVVGEDGGAVIYERAL
jgi:hypothetical protein